MKKSNIKWIILMIGIDSVWGMTFVANDYLLGFMSPEIMVTAKLTVAAIFATTLVLIRDKGFRIEKKDLPRVILVGLAGMFIYNNLEGIGINLTSAAVASLVLATVPIFVALVDLVFYGNRVNKITVIGIIGSILGVVILTLGAKETEINATVLGLAAMVAGAFAWSLYIIGIKPIEKKYDPLLMVATFTSVSSICGWLVMPVYKPETPQITTVVIIVLAITAIMGFVVTQYFYIKVIKHISVTTVGIFENLVPVTSVIGSFILFGELLTGVQLIGAVVILLSVTLVTLKG